MEGIESHPAVLCSERPVAVTSRPEKFAVWSVTVHSGLTALCEIIGLSTKPLGFGFGLGVYRCR